MVVGIFCGDTLLRKTAELKGVNHTSTANAVHLLMYTRVQSSWNINLVNLYRSRVLYRLPAT